MQRRPIKKALISAIAVLGCALPFLSDIANAKQNKLSEEVIFTCDAFPTKIEGCETYSCYVTMGGVMTVMEILGDRGPLCAVSTTIGVTLPPSKPKKGEEPKPPMTVPVTTVCEYDRNGVNQLSNKFQAMKGGRFDLSSDEMELGEHNCQTYALGQSFPTPRARVTKREVWQ